jgi:hypothetical protein
MAALCAGQVPFATEAWAPLTLLQYGRTAPKRLLFRRGRRKWGVNIEITKAVLQKACKHRGLSTNVSKAVLSQLLADAGFGDPEDVLRLSKELYEPGPTSRTILEQPRSNFQHNWSPNWLARIRHVLADPRHITALAALY